MRGHGVPVNRIISDKKAIILIYLTLKLDNQSFLGRGAYMKGDFKINKGEIIKILVGQEAPLNTQSQSAGGGGGSFVVRNNNAPLLVAGGGGGIERLNKRLDNCDASTKTSGKNNKCVTPCKNWAGGVNGQGAKQADSGNSGCSRF